MPRLPIEIACFFFMACASMAVLSRNTTFAQEQSDGGIEELEPDAAEEPLPVPEGRGRRQVGGGERYAHYSPSLEALFVIRKFRLRDQIFFGARLVEDPDPESPLRALGLRAGDVITRLDGYSLNSYRELDRHFDDTSVRYVRHRSNQVRQGQIFIDAQLEAP